MYFFIVFVFLYLLGFDIFSISFFDVYIFGFFVVRVFEINEVCVGKDIRKLEKSK